jgi:hypothetical protein
MDMLIAIIVQFVLTGIQTRFPCCQVDNRERL